MCIVHKRTVNFFKTPMPQAIVSLEKKFISIKSTPTNKKALEEALNLALSRLKGYTIERFERNGVKSALIYNAKRRPKKFRIILNGHLDVIPGKEHQYIPEIKGNRLYGVGSMDMKGSVACLIAAFKNTANRVNYPLGLQLVTDEEIGGFNGTKYQIDKDVRTDFAIIGESTDLNIENKAKGVLWMKIRAKGKAAHGAYPWKGENAAWKMHWLLSQLEKSYPVLKKEKWVTTVGLAALKTDGQTFNKIPDECEVWLDVRYIPEDTNLILKNIKRLIPKEFKLEIVAKEPPLSTDKNNQYVKLLKREIGQITGKRTRILSANGSSDARHFARIGCPAIEFGPTGKGMGSDAEWVDIPSLKKYYQILKEFLLTVKS